MLLKSLREIKNLIKFIKKQGIKKFKLEELELEFENFENSAAPFQPEKHKEDPELLVSVQDIVRTDGERPTVQLDRQDLW